MQVKGSPGNIARDVMCWTLMDLTGITRKSSTNARRNRRCVLTTRGSIRRSVINLILPSISYKFPLSAQII